MTILKMVKIIKIVVAVVAAAALSILIRRIVVCYVQVTNLSKRFEGR